LSRKFILASRRRPPGSGTAIAAHAAADVSAWEREIDQLVYRLYGLTPEEIKIVEEGAKQ